MPTSLFKEKNIRKMLDLFMKLMFGLPHVEKVWFIFLFGEFLHGFVEEHSPEFISEGTADSLDEYLQQSRSLSTIWISAINILRFRSEQCQNANLSKTMKEIHVLLQVLSSMYEYLIQHLEHIR